MKQQEFGERLRAFRIEHGYTQQDVATALGVAISTYRRYETENMLPQSAKLQKLAALYNMSIDQLVGIDTVVTFRYDRNDLGQLRTALASNNLPVMQAALKRLRGERTAAFAPPDIPMEQLESISKGTLRTIQIEPENEHLVNYASDRELQLRYAGHVMHDGLYYLQTYSSLCTIQAALEGIKNPFGDGDADDFRTLQCDVFAKALYDTFGYDIYIMQNDPARHIFCMKDGKYIDVRGWTEDFYEFTADLVAGSDYVPDMVVPYTTAVAPDPKIEKFAKWLIGRNQQYYTV